MILFSCNGIQSPSSLEDKKQSESVKSNNVNDINKDQESLAETNDLFSINKQK